MHASKRIPFPRFQNARIRTSGRVPHWELDNAFYSITFRLGDALPRSVVASLQDERRRIIRSISGTDEPTLEQLAEIQRLFGVRVDHYLDLGYGSCSLAEPGIAELVANALRFFDGDRYRLYGWAVMPNHVHVAMFLEYGAKLEKILHSWKSFTASRANTILGEEGTFWQKDYVDRIIRDEGDLESTIQYIWTNPERAGLKDWFWKWRMGE
ncbi:MAG TPA: transposase [Thermoanaerobaculia bacterium]|nr:transposase [Thermoanaerobaculia bacterium]